MTGHSNLVFLVAFAVAFSALAASSEPLFGSGGRDSSRRVNEITVEDDPNFCQLVLYRSQEFQGRPYVIMKNKRKLKGLEKSIKTKGELKKQAFGELAF